MLLPHSPSPCSHGLLTQDLAWPQYTGICPFSWDILTPETCRLTPSLHLDLYPNVLYFLNIPPKITTPPAPSNPPFCFISLLSKCHHYTTLPITASYFPVAVCCGKSALLSFITNEAHISPRGSIRLDVGYESEGRSSHRRLLFLEAVCIKIPGWGSGSRMKPRTPSRGPISGPSGKTGDNRRGE